MKHGYNPLTIHEIYASACDLKRVHDLSWAERAEASAYGTRRNAILAVRSARKTKDIRELVREIEWDYYHTRAGGVQDLEINEAHTHPLVVACWEDFGTEDQESGYELACEVIGDREYEAGRP